MPPVPATPPPVPHPRRARITRIAASMLASAAAVTAAACAATPATGSSQAGGQRPELATVTVDMAQIPDAAPLIIAQDHGFFQQQGLHVTITYVPGTANGSVVAGLAAHTVDFALENYVGAFSEEAASPRLGLRIIADDLQAAPGTFDLMVPRHSRITSLAGLKGKTIAFPALGLNDGTLALDEQLRGYGITAGSYTVVPMAFPDMTAPLARGEVDAAFATQPFITVMESRIGAQPLADLMTGPMADFPLSGWATTAWMQQHYPKTVAAFQRAIEKAQQLAASDQALVRHVLPQYITGLSPKIASVMTLATYNTTLSLTRLQRVADIMEQFKALPPDFDVKSMVIPLPPGA
jgi:NitT/TauT family transport system substrate-binding protein